MTIMTRASDCADHQRILLAGCATMPGTTAPAIRGGMDSRNRLSLAVREPAPGHGERLTQLRSDPSSR